ncbi:class I SAM-dependent methyltransferase [Acidipropionibacterium timonense]|uniref:class I SAM-dependent methyltransferase n=1 Tax=Acidipropionibacterium timonense TaxID=2161818 RepID=UPI00102F8CD4|nr:class I SAM-dependent methyltransferase [Acidipropionibacterium timonense]
MDVEVARALVGPEGDRALEVARAESDPDSLGAAARLRSQFAPDLAAAALDQASMTERAVTKIGEVARSMLWTRDGLEQATRGEVSTWRAERLVAAGVRRVIDLGCSCGADARACLDAGLEVTAVEIDPAVATLAAHNLPGARVVAADATAVAADLVSGAGPETAVLLDPARRGGRGRSWRLEDIRPPWPFVTRVLEGPWVTVVKMAPGVDRGVLPGDAATTFVGSRGDLVEATIWKGPRMGRGASAVLVPGDEVVGGDSPEPDPGPVGSYLAEPHPAAIRARASGTLVEGHPDARTVSRGIAYLTADRPWTSPWLRWFKVEESLPMSEKVLRGWVRDHHVGTLEVKKRGLDVDPAALRRRLRPSGPASATLICTPTVDGARAVVATRVTVS